MNDDSQTPLRCTSKLISSRDSHPIAPSLWLLSPVNARDDHNFFLGGPINNAIWKPAKKCAPDVRQDFRILKGRSFNHRNRAIKCTQKLGCQTRGSRFIPLGRGGNLFFSLSSKYEPSTHAWNLVRSRSRTCSHEMAESGSTS